MQIFSKKKKGAGTEIADRLPPAPAPPKPNERMKAPAGTFEPQKALPPAPRPAPVKLPKPVPPPKEAPKEKLSVKTGKIPQAPSVNVSVSVSGADIGKKASRSPKGPGTALLDKPPTKEELMEMRKEVSAMKRIMAPGKRIRMEFPLSAKHFKPSRKAEKPKLEFKIDNDGTKAALPFSSRARSRVPEQKAIKARSRIEERRRQESPSSHNRLPASATKSAPLVNISIFDRKEGFSLADRAQSSSRQAPKPSIAPKKPAAAKSKKVAPTPARIAKPVQTGKSEIKDIKRTVTSMKKDMEVVKAKTGKLPEKRHIEEIKKIVKKIPAGKKPSVGKKAIEDRRRRGRLPAKSAFRPSLAGKKKPGARPPKKHKHHMIKPLPEDEIRDLRTSVRETDKSITRIARDLMKLDERLADTSEDAKKAYIGPLSDSDVKIVKAFVSRSGDFEKSAAGVNVKLDKLDRTMDIFTERMDSIKRDLADMKIRQVSRSGSGKDSKLEERVAEIEAKLSEGKGEKPGTGARETKDVLERIAGLEKSLETMRTFRAAATSLPEASKGMTERMDSVDARITGISEKLMQLGGDVQKITEYFMQGMRYTESRLRVIEHDAGAQKAMDMMPRPRPRPAPSAYGPRPKAPEPVREPADHIDFIFLPRPGQPRQEAQPAQAPKPYPDTSAQLALPSPPLPPVPGREPPESTIFTKLRESTVVRKQLPRMDSDTHDLEIIVEQIGESMHRGDTREKIEKDLLTAGFDQELVDKAFMQARVG